MRVILQGGWGGWPTGNEKEAKQLPSTAGPGNMLGCSLISIHYLWAIHPIRPVILGQVGLKLGLVT